MNYFWTISLCLILAMLGSCTLSSKIDSIEISQLKLDDAPSYNNRLSERAGNTQLEDKSVVEVAFLIDRDLLKTQRRFDLHHYYLKIGKCNWNSTGVPKIEREWEWETLSSDVLIDVDKDDGSSNVKFHIDDHDFSRIGRVFPELVMSPVDGSFCVRMGAGAMWGTATFSTNLVRLENDEIETLNSLRVR